MYEITIRKTFSAAHVLREIGGKCESLHGHNFAVEVSVAGNPLNEEGLLVDFRLVKRWLQEVIDGLDHTYLNELDCFKDLNPSSERIARFIHERLSPQAQRAGLAVSRVTVWESENARVSYSL